MDTAQASEPRPPQNVREHGFRLIVGGVRNRHAIHVVLLCDLPEILIAGAARGILEIGTVSFGPCGNVRGSAAKLQLVFCSQLGHKFFVGVRSLAAQFVIEVHDAENDSQFLTQFQQQEQ